MRYIKFFSELSLNDVNIVGGKNASLGEMYKNLTPLDIKVPNGFATTSEAYWLFLSHNTLEEKITAICNSSDSTQIDQLQKSSKKIKDLILSSSLPKELEDEIEEAYTKLCSNYTTTDVAVRSSATAEDLPEVSFAGQ
jgi:pyruvate,water dikinase